MHERPSPRRRLTAILVRTRATNAGDGSTFTAAWIAASMASRVTCRSRAVARPCQSFLQVFSRLEQTRLDRALRDAQERRDFRHVVAPARAASTTTRRSLSGQGVDRPPDVPPAAPRPPAGSRRRRGEARHARALAPPSAGRSGGDRSPAATSSARARRETDCDRGAAGTSDTPSRRPPARRPRRLHDAATRCRQRETPASSSRPGASRTPVRAARRRSPGGRPISRRVHRPRHQARRRRALFRFIGVPCGRTSLSRRRA